MPSPAKPCFLSQSTRSGFPETHQATSTICHLQTSTGLCDHTQSSSIMAPSTNTTRVDLREHKVQSQSGNRVTISEPNGHPTSPASTVSPSTSVLEGSTSSNGTEAQLPTNRNGPPRKVSSPLMPAFMVSAPGKVIVYGEHAVVHGKVSSTLGHPACQHTKIYLGSHRGSDLPPFIPTVHLPLEVQPYGFLTLPRYSARPHLEH